MHAMVGIMHRIGFWFRVLALIIDFAIFLPLVIVPSLFFGASRQVTNLVLLCGWLLYSTFEVFSVGTPGKQLLGLGIARANGSAADFWTLSLRWSAKQSPVVLVLVFITTHAVAARWLASLMECLVVIGCLYASTEFRQAWHDEWAHTAVFRLPKAPPPRGFAVVQTKPPPLPARAADDGEMPRLGSAPNQETAQGNITLANGRAELRACDVIRSIGVPPVFSGSNHSRDGHATKKITSSDLTEGQLVSGTSR